VTLHSLVEREKNKQNIEERANRITDKDRTRVIARRRSDGNRMEEREGRKGERTNQDNNANPLIHSCGQIVKKRR